MWNEQRQYLQAQLAPQEQLLWSGQPQSGIVFRRSDALTVPFSLMWGGFAIFWETTVFLSGAPFFFKLWGIPFVLVGLYMIVGRFIVDAKQRAKTYYGITNERIIIVSGLGKRKVKSLNLSTLTDLSMEEGANGSGTIFFGPANAAFGWLAGTPFNSRGVQPPPSFEMIRGAKAVYETIRNAQRASLTPMVRVPDLTAE